MSGAVLILYILSAFLRERTSARLRFACWLVAAAGLLVPVRPALYSVSARDVLPAAVSDSIARISDPPRSVYSPYPDAQMPSGESAVADKAVPVATDGAAAPQTPVLSAPAQTPAPAPVASHFWEDLSVWLSDKWLAAVWAAGALAFLSMCVSRQRRFSRNIRRWSRPAADEAVLALWDSVCRETGLRRCPRLLICPLAASPVMCGLFRPTLVLPEGVVEPERLRLMFLHEALHVRRGDVWAKALALAALAVNWFNPFAWLVNRRLAAEAEMACDAAVLRYAGADVRFAYCETVLSAARRSRETALLASAFAGNVNGLKRRLSSILVRRETKRWVAAFCSGLLLMGVLAAGLAGCGGMGQMGGYSPIADAKVDLTPTDQLVLDFPGYQYFPQMYETAVSVFKRQYPDVTVTINTMGDADNYPNDQYQTALLAEIMAGSGPDVILTDYFTSDLYKTMDTGAFLNLNSVISQDQGFQMSDYNETVMKAGYYKGGQYIMPLGYTLPLLLGEQSALDGVGFDTAKANTLADFFNEITACLPAMQANSGFVRAVNQVLYYSLAQTAGVSLANEETKAVALDEAGVRAFCEAYKPYFEIDTSDNFASTSDDALSTGATFFSDISDGPSRLLEYCYVQQNVGTPALAAIPSMSGGLEATTTSGAAIRGGSPNQLNAWNFIKILLSASIQYCTPGTMDGVEFAFPVNNTALQQEIDYCAKPSPPGTVLSSSGDPSDTWTSKGMSDEDKAAYQSLISGVTGCSLTNYPIIQIFNRCVTPYFKDEKSLDDCISDLKSQLGIYISE